MKNINFTAMKRNSFLFIALFLFASTSVFAQIIFPKKGEEINWGKNITVEKAKADFENIMRNAPLIIRGDFVSGTSPSDVSKRLPDEKPYIENNWYMVPKKIKVKAVLRGDTALIGKIISIPIKIGLTFEGELLESSHAKNYLPYNDKYDEYYILNNTKNKFSLFENNSIGFYSDYNKLYGFAMGFSATEKSFFQAIIDSKNYNPKFMLEAGMKIPEKEKKAVGFLVKETEEPNDKNK